MSDEIYVATTTFATEVDGEPVVIHAGVDRVRAGHALLKANPDNFKRESQDVRFEVEEATAAPAQGRRARVRRGPVVVPPTETP
jgi:hypothetical protein